MNDQLAIKASINARSPMTESQRQELQHWATSELERPNAAFVPCLVAKIAEFGPVFLNSIESHMASLGDSFTVLELGGGQGWASCMVKSRFPNARVVATDISIDALASLGKWEHALGVKVDEAVACLSNDLPFADATVDVVFAFASAHHFRKHKKTFAEISRVLRAGGRCFYLYEPSCHPALYPLALWRVERKRPTPPEDVLRYSEIKKIALDAGLRCEIKLNLNLAGRGPIEMMYYLFLRRIKALLWFLPCTMDYLFVKIT